MNANAIIKELFGDDVEWNVHFWYVRPDPSSEEFTVLRVDITNVSCETFSRVFNLPAPIHGFETEDDVYCVIDIQNDDKLRVHYGMRQEKGSPYSVVITHDRLRTAYELATKNWIITNG